MQRRALLTLAALATTGLAHARCTAKPSPPPSIHNTEPITMNDVIIIGGSFAGLAAALQLGRARRKVTVLDTGLPRNRFAGHSHRLILSYGVADQMPDVPGFAEGWGTSIVPCPYCDGFEVAGQHWGLVWSGRQSHNQVRLFHDWTDRLTVFANGHDIPPDIRADLTRRNTPVVDGRIIEIAHHGGHNATVKLDTGPNVAVDILFAHPRNKPSASLHESLGLATVNTPLGIALKVDERRETSMPGIYAAGDLANPLMPSVTLASSHGATAGISAQQSMLV